MVVEDGRFRIRAFPDTLVFDDCAFTLRFGDACAKRDDASALKPFLPVVAAVHAVAAEKADSITIFISFLNVAFFMPLMNVFVIFIICLIVYNKVLLTF
jgi:hypothetical protein